MNAARGLRGFAIARRETSPTVGAPPLSRRFATSRDGSLRAMLGFDSQRLHHLASGFRRFPHESPVPVAKLDPPRKLLSLVS